MALFEILGLILLVLVFVITSIPLHLAVSILGGHSSLLKAALANLIVGLAGGIIFLFVFRYAGIIFFIALLLIYKVMFDLGWLRALLVWLLQGIIAVLLIMLLAWLGAIVL